MDPAKGSTAPVEGQLVLLLDDELIRQLQIRIRTISPEIAKSLVVATGPNWTELLRTGPHDSDGIAMLDFSTRLHQRRTELGVSLRSLASESGLDRKTITAWEKGTQDPNPALVARLTRPLTCSLDWLLHGEGEEPEHGNDRGEDHQG